MAFRFGPRIATNGLILYLDAGNPRSYPRSGNIWSNLMPIGLTGILSSTTYDSANLGSITFNGSTSYVDLSSNSLLNITTGDFAIELSFYYQDNSPTLYSKIAARGVYLNPGWTVYAGYDGIRHSFGLQYGSASWISVGNGIITPNTWNHGVITRLNGVINSYLNGVNIGSRVDSYDFNAPSTILRIGSNSSGTEIFKGKVSMYRQYSRGLTSDEVYQHYAATRSRYGLT